MCRVAFLVLGERVSGAGQAGALPTAQRASTALNFWVRDYRKVQESCASFEGGWRGIWSPLPQKFGAELLAKQWRHVQAAKPAPGVAPGDVLTFTQGDTVRVVRVIAHGLRRGPATEAQTLYEDLTPAREDVPPAPQAQDGGRPTKRDRRIFDLDRRRMLE